MPRFAANLTMQFNEVGFLDRFELAARAGFTGVEYLFPYDHDPQALVDRLGQAGLVQVLFNLPAGDWAAGDRGIAASPQRVGEFRDGVGRAIEYATALGCSQLNCLAGIPSSVAPDVARATLVDNLRFAAVELSAVGIRLNLEAINTRDVPGFLVSTTKDAIAILDEVGHDGTFLQYDAYHMQVMEEDLSGTIARHIGRIGHIQVADDPGRHEPGTGRIDHPALFRAIDEAGYSGWVGCEYVPLTTTIEGLTWMTPYLPSTRNEP